MLRTFFFMQCFQMLVHYFFFLISILFVFPWNLMYNFVRKKLQGILEETRGNDCWGGGNNNNIINNIFFVKLMCERFVVVLTEQSLSQHTTFLMLNSIIINWEIVTAFEKLICESADENDEFHMGHLVSSYIYIKYRNMAIISWNWYFDFTKFCWWCWILNYSLCQRLATNDGWFQISGPMALDMRYRLRGVSTVQTFP